MPAAFIQIIDYRTGQPEAVDDLLSRWIASSAGQRTARRTRVCRDVHDPTHYVEILEFDSAEDALTNSQLPQTNAVHEQFAGLCTAGPSFTDLSVARDQPL